MSTSRAPLTRMLTYSDVSADPSAFERSKLRESQIAEARALGFDSLAWVGAMVDAAPADAPVEQRGFVSAVMFKPDAPMTLSLSHTSEVGDDYALKTLFVDGSIVMTETAPQKNARRLMLGVSSAPRAGVDIAFVFTTSIAELLERHEQRVREREAKGTRPVAQHDLRVHFAMKKRWREIADPRMRLQTRIAIGIGLAVTAAIVVAPIVMMKPLTSLLGEALAHVLRTAAIVGCVPAGIFAFTFAIHWIAPVLARLASAPPMRPADELLGLADGVYRGRLPKDPANTKPAMPAVVDLSASELARLQRLDVVVTMGSALALPLLALASMPTLGLVGTWVIFSVVLTFDGLVEVITKKTRTALVRERLVPELVRAETSLANAACAGGACALPKGWSQWIRLGLGVLAMLAIPKMLALPHEPVSMTVVAQWSFAGFVIFATTLSQTKKRHKQLVAAR